MLHLFQVNTGTRIPLSTDVPLTARVEALCSTVNDLDKNDTILMTAEGKQMLPDQTIASYSAGTEQKPIYVFSKRHLERPNPPLLSWQSAPSGNPVEKELEALLRKTPSPSNFQKQTVLAKQLADYAEQLFNHGKTLAEECTFQFSGLQAAIANCKGIINEYRRHHNLFSNSVNSFISTVPYYKTLLVKFRDTVGLLKLLPFPLFAYGPGINPATLYDWIKSQDEESSLDALESECMKAIKQVDEEMLQKALSESEAMLAGHENNIALGLPDAADNFTSLIKSMEESYNVQYGLATNIQETSQKALRSGDGATVAVLTSSHHNSLQLMQKRGIELWSCVVKLRERRQEITKQVHDKLQNIALVQMKLSTNNDSLVFWHEFIKLARRRFEVLMQIECIPEVLGCVIAEVERRRLYKSTFIEYAKKVSRLFREARDAERNLRRTFKENYYHHFILTLFPSLSDRPPEFAISIPENFDEQLSLLAEDDLDALKRHLPSNVNVSNSVVLLHLQHDQETQTAVVNMCTLDGDRTNKELDSDMAIHHQQIQTLTIQLEDEQRKNRILSQDMDKNIGDVGALRLQLENEKQNWANQLQQVEIEKDALKRDISDIVLKKDLLTQEIEMLSTKIKQITLERDSLANHIHQVKEEKEALSNDIRQWGQKENELNTVICQLQQSNKVLSNDNELLQQQSKEVEAVVLQMTSEKELLTTQMEKKEHGACKELESLKVELRQSLACIQMERESWLVEQNKTRDEIEKLKVENHTLNKCVLQYKQQNNTLCQEGEALRSELEASRQIIHTKNIELAQCEKNKHLLEQLHSLKVMLEQSSEESKMKVLQLNQQLENKNHSIIQLQESYSKIVSDLCAKEADVVKLTHELQEIRSCLKEAEDKLYKEKAVTCQLKTELESLFKEKGALEKLLETYQDEKLYLQHELSEMMDTKMKESMELERELRELRRSTEKVPTSPPAPKMTSVSISNLQMGDLAIFVPDPSHNYLAFALDGSTYYLHQSCARSLEQYDTFAKMCDPLKRCAFTRGMFIGKITNKSLLEVKKETNRFKMPVGSRLYQLYATYCTDSSAS